MKYSQAEKPEDIEAVINKYSDMLFRICILTLKNESDTEDVVQETFIKYFQKAPDFHDNEHEKAWLIRVAVNHCRDIIRYRSRHPQMEDEWLAKTACNSEESGIIEALTTLPEKYRLVLTLYYIENYRTEEIAKIINKSTSAVKMRLQKGRKLLEKIYREEYM